MTESKPTEQRITRARISVTYINDLNRIVRTDYADHDIKLRLPVLPDGTVLKKQSADWLNKAHRELIEA